MFSNFNLYFFKPRFKNLGLSLGLGILVGLLVLYLSSVAGNWLFLFTIGLLLLVFALFARVQQGSWLAPGAFFALYWAVFVLGVLIIAPDFDVRVEGLLWILFSTFAVYLGSIVGLGKMLFRAVPYSMEKKINNSSNCKLNFPWISQIVVICSILGLGAVVVLILSTGQGFSLESIFKIGREYSIARYSDPTYREPALAVFLFIFIYLGALFGGIKFAIAQSRWHRLIALFPFLPAIGVATILTTRASLYFPFVIWMATYFSIKVAINKGIFSLFTFRSVILMFSFVLLIVAIGSGLLMLRFGIATINTQSLLMVYDGMRIDIFGSLSAFTQWFAEHWQEVVIPLPGGFTFRGPLKWVGVTEFLQHKPVEISSSFTHYGFTTTIFTLFRDLISDFTLIGSILILFLLGAVGGFSFRQMIQGKIIYLPILAAFYGVTLCSFTGTSLFSYTTILLAWIIFTFYLIFVEIGKWLSKINN